MEVHRYHWAYAFWIAPALLLAASVRGKGAWLANTAAVLGFAGMVTLPGMLIVDWYQSAIGQLHGLDGVLALEKWGSALAGAFLAVVAFAIAQATKREVVTTR